ncbi:hypothetical protein AGDE_09032 [Angomonas deanei]|nr:hypothetical protein AGDE_09032 [Angomonas deanei]|eukprot:EPY31478.1 hypothetical protein AGDE_09032 [Angomonas deanei]
MNSIFAELDTSTELGSGFISVVGPPGSGKTNSVVTYLARREERYRVNQAAKARLGERVVPVMKDRPNYQIGEMREGVVQVEYFTATATTGDTLARISHRLQLDPSKRRVAMDCGPLQFGNTVTQWLEAHPAGSELHIVIDDADQLSEDIQQIELWLSNAFSEFTLSRLFCVWLVSQIPLRLKSCFRFHLVSSPSVETVCQWLETVFRRNLLTARGEERAEDSLEEFLFAENAHRVTVQAVQHYMEHLPMKSSIVCKDVRQLLQRVYLLLPSLVAASNHFGSKLNTMHFSTAWGQLGPEGRFGAPGAEGDGGDLLVEALRRIGLSAVLLAFCCFYCGCVAPSKLAQALGGEAARESGSSHEANRNSHRSAVLSSSCHKISIPKLTFTYNALAQICIQTIDPLEFAMVELAMHHLVGFVSWGLLTPVNTQGGPTYKCWIPISTALQLGKVLHLNLYDLLPT